MDSYLKSDYFKPDLFTKLVVEALEWEFGSIKEFCRQHSFSVVQFSRGLTPQGEESLPTYMVDAVCDTLGLKKAALSSVFMSRWMNPVSVWYPSSVLCIIRPLVVHCPLRGALVFSLSFGNHSVCLFIDFLCTFLQLQPQHRH